MRPVGKHTTGLALSTALSAVSSEEAHTTWTDQQSHDNEHNTPEDPAAKDRDNAGYNEDYRNDPEKCCHGIAPFRLTPTGHTHTAAFGSVE